jgi:hypothetical protein
MRTTLIAASPRAVEMAAMVSESIADGESGRRKVQEAIQRDANHEFFGVEVLNR